jgi:hypothetical protein
MTGILNVFLGTFGSVPKKVVDFKLWAGGGGGTSGPDGFGAGSGGFVAGTLSIDPGSTLKVVVGAGGSAGVGGKAGGGGGYCGVFLSSVAHGNALLIAGAGSSGARSAFPGVGGGGLTGKDGGGTNGFGGTQSAGGATSGANPGTAGSALQGGAGALGPSGGAVYGGGPDGGGDNATATPGSGGAGYYGGGARVTQPHQGQTLVVRAAGDRVILGWQHPPQTHKETMVLVGQAAQQLILVIQSTSLARMLAGTEAKVGQPPQVEMVRVFTVWTAVLGLC